MRKGKILAGAGLFKEGIDAGVESAHGPGRFADPVKILETENPGSVGVPAVRGSAAAGFAGLQALSGSRHCS